MDIHKRIAISGGFDPLHPGHIAMIESARVYGEVHVILNSDAWLIRKKGFLFQPWSDRKKILEAYTPHVHTVDDTDGTVCEALRRITPDYFGNGGDRCFSNTPELELCEASGIEPIFGLGGGKYASSSAVNARARVETRWGYYNVIIDMSHLKIKLIHVDAGKSLSLQKHTHRSEFFFMPNGEVRINLPGVWHVLQAPAQTALDVVEVQVGPSYEDDISKIREDDGIFEQEKRHRIHLNH